MSDIRKPLLPQREGSSHSTPGARRHLHDAYAIEDRIGGGADGRVCRGIARKGPYEGEAHAIKRFREKAYDPELEMRVLAAVQPHPHILQMLDVYVDGLGVAFAAPESDMNLREFMARRPLGLAATQAWEFNRQILSGIQHLHKTTSGTSGFKTREHLTAYGAPRVKLASGGLQQGKRNAVVTCAATPARRSRICRLRS